MHTHYHRKAVLITGASSGIGQATAQYLKEMGFQVFAGVRQQQESEGIESLKKAIIPVLLDVTREEDIKKAVKFIETHTGSTGLSGLVNNAGISAGGPMEFIGIDKVREVMEVNLMGAISVTQSFLPMLRRGGGRIVNVSSISGRLALPFVGPYAASKFALEAFSDSLRVELKPWRIPVSIIEPGDVSTPIWEKTGRIVKDAIKEFPSTAHDQYGPIFDKINTIKIHGIPPSHVARKIHHALTAKRPKARYLVGPDAKMVAVIACLPPIIRDMIIRQFLPPYGETGKKNKKRSIA
jgi:NAD(P)-dependent dehydrogenase (short-subunit alcohol dehydrogenase family)